MSELGDLVGVLGAVDDHVVAHPELIPEVGRLLRPYQHGAAGWFPVFRRWLAERPRPADLPPVEIPDLDEALAGLASLDDDTTEPQDPGLRLLTIAVCGRVMPGYGPVGENAANTLGALTVPGLAAGDGGRAERLLQLLTDTSEYPDASTWDAMMRAAVADNLIAPDAAQPLRCQGEIVEVNVGDHDHPASAITTSMIATDLTFADASAVLDPTEWPQCCPIWCGMKPSPPDPDGSTCYEETIGLACPQTVLTTCLRFTTQATPMIAVAAYQLHTPKAGCHGDGEVLVDEGSIEVHDRGTLGVSVRTTKRVLFKSVPPGPLSMFSCLFGYGDMGQLLVYGAARRHAKGGETKKGGATKKGGSARAPKAKKKLPEPVDPPTREGTAGHDCNTLIHDVSTLAKDFVRDTAAVYRESYAKVVAGTYTSDEAAADVSKAVRRTSRDLAKAVDLGVRGAGLARKEAATAPPDGEDAE